MEEVVDAQKSLTDPSSHKTLTLLLKVAGSGLLLFLLLKNLDWAALWLALTSADKADLLGALLLGFLFVLIRAYKWFYLLKTHRSDLKFSNVLVSYMFGLGVGILTPGRVGEVARISNLGFEKRSGAVGLFLYDKVLDIFSVFVLSLYGALFFFAPFKALIWSAFIVGVLAFYYLKQSYGFLKRQSSRLPLADKFERLFETMSNLNKTTMFNALVLTIASYLICIVEVYFILKAFGFIHLDYVFKVHPIVMLTNLFPFTIGGIGLREMASVFFYAQLGITQESAFWGGLLIFVFNTLFYGILGVILINFMSTRGKK